MNGQNAPAEPALAVAPFDTAIDIAQVTGHLQAKAFEVRGSVYQGVLRRPTYVFERVYNARTALQADKPIAAIGGGAEYRIAGFQ